MVGHLQGLNEYLDENYRLSVFDTALDSQESWDLHVHNHRIISARIIENQTYDVVIDSEDEGEQTLPKTDVKFLYRSSSRSAVRRLIKTERKVKDLKLEPIPSPRNRYHIKNKSLFPLMHERKVVFVTLLEGEIARGIIVDFSRYEITINLKGGVSVTILRHSVYDLCDKKGRCFLKSSQEEHRDWEKSSLYVPSPPEH